METYTQFGSYQIVRKVGAGGMADVYEAVRVGLANFQTRVALKCILPSMTRNDRFVRMFINEAHLGSQLQHPNIIQIQDFNKVNDTYYIAMEFVEGVDLSRIIKRLAARHLSFPPTVIIDLCLQALAGLGYAHVARSADGNPMGIIHRDVKPSNFIITPSGVLKVGDFGIAKAATSAGGHSLTGEQIKGTINYMSPEQIDGVTLTPASDLFSLGAILFELLTLSPLFDGPTMSSILLKIAMVNIKSDLDLVSNRYPDFLPVLRKALDRDPADRYQSAPEMVIDLSKLREKLGDGLSLRDFLSMHKELFSPFGTQPGDEEESNQPLSMMVTPVHRLERPDIFQDPSAPSVDAHRFEVDEEQDYEIELPPDPDLQEPEPSESSIGSQVDFVYYPPEEMTEALDSSQEILQADRASQLSAEEETTRAVSLSAKDGTTPAVRPSVEEETTRAAQLSVEEATTRTEAEGKPVEPLDWDQTARSIAPPEYQADWQEDLGSVAQQLLPEDSGEIDVMTLQALARQEESTVALQPATFESEEEPDEPIVAATRRRRRVGLFFVFFALIAGVSAVLWSGSTSEESTVLPQKHIEEAVVPTSLPHMVAASRLEVDSEPKGATVSIQGLQVRETTPATIELPSDRSSVSILVQLNGYQPYTRELEYGPGQTLIVEPKLVSIPKVGSISVESVPKGALVLLNGKETGKSTPTLLDDVKADQRYSVRLRKAGYLDAEREIAVNGDKTTPVFVRMIHKKQGRARLRKSAPRNAGPSNGLPATPPPSAPVVEQPKKAVVVAKATLILNATNPPDATVYIDGVSKGEVPTSVIVSAGSHVVEFRSLDGKSKKSTRVELVAGDRKKLIWDFASQDWKAR